MFLFYRSNAGRRPNVHSLGLEELGVKMTKGGAIDVDAYSQSSVRAPCWGLQQEEDGQQLRYGRP